MSEEDEVERVADEIRERLQRIPAIGKILIAGQPFKSNSHWDFQPEDVHCPNLYWWHGE